MKQLLLPKRTKEHWLYTNLRDWNDSHSAERREFFKSWWHEYAPFAPKGFPKKLQIEIHQRWWEMYLVVGLLHLGFIPNKSKTDIGPDVIIDVGDQQVFIEATAPSVGDPQTSDRVPDRVYNKVTDFPERECLLRLSQALTGKCRQIHDFVDEKKIPSDPCTIIALSASDLNQFGTHLDAAHPALLSVLAGAGPTVVPFDGKQPPYSSRRSTLKRNSGSEVDAALFEDKSFSIVSGVLYSAIDLWNATLHPENTLTLFVNPLAINPIPYDFQKRFPRWIRNTPAGDKTVWGKLPPSNSPDIKP